MNAVGKAESNAKADAALFSALANENRMQIVTWLRDPVAHFPTQVDGDLVEDGVCVGAIVDKLHLAQPTVTAHMKLLKQAGFVDSKRIKQWTFYKLNGEAVLDAASVLSALARES